MQFHRCYFFTVSELHVSEINHLVYSKAYVDEIYICKCRSSNSHLLPESVKYIIGLLSILLVHEVRDCMSLKSRYVLF